MSKSSKLHPSFDMGACIHPVKYPLLLRDRNFVLLLSGQTLATFGNNMYILALLWMVQMETLHRAHSALFLGLVMMAAFLPRVLFAPIAGVLTDRWPKRVLMLVTDISRGGLLVLLTFLTLFHQTGPWELIAFNFVLSSLGTVFNPASVVLTKEVASDELLLRARSILNVGQKTMEIAGPAASGLLIGLLGSAVVFGINAATFFFSALTLTLMRVQEPERRKSSLAPKALVQDVKEGASLYLASPYARTLTPFVLMYNFPVVAIEFLIVNFVANTLHYTSNRGAFIVGFFNTALAIGELSGSFTIPFFSRTLSKERLPIIAMSISAACLTTVGFMRSPVLIALLMFIAGFCMIVSSTIFFTSIQLAVPHEALGRIYALLGAVFDAATPISQLLFGTVAAVIPVSLLISGAGGLAFLGISSAWLSPLVQHPPKDSVVAQHDEPVDSEGNSGGNSEVKPNLGPDVDVAVETRAFTSAALESNLHSNDI
ncbi:MFS transporter [Alicyclobacillus sp. ALC3]|uniref:MFS transporter n=1 Tax=Alicyclobacillus sp. ALC3 TaxID=2796143 RepID=UPI002377DD72|nr:MFS transporter [Alicyclobacillus sp. ALC3]WDL98595.1 MFS transporter [Alicyclobacillus sp. ALC3]